MRQAQALTLSIHGIAGWGSGGEWLCWICEFKLYHMLSNAGTGDTLHISIEERERWCSSEAKAHLHSATGILFTYSSSKLSLEPNLNCLKLHQDHLKSHQNSLSVKQLFLLHSTNYSMVTAGRGENESGHRTFGESSVDYSFTQISQF